jgi:alkyl hydroperoxide reductase subunit AhpF
MAMIPIKDGKKLREHFGKHIQGPVTIDYFTQGDSPLPVPIQECMFCRETGEMLREVAELSDRITLNVHDFVTESEVAKAHGITRVPAFVLSGAAKGKVRFFGIPSGYEFAALIEAIVDVGRGKTDLAPRALEELAGLRRNVHVQVFSTPT